MDERHASTACSDAGRGTLVQDFAPDSRATGQNGSSSHAGGKRVSGEYPGSVVSGVQSYKSDGLGNAGGSQVSQVPSQSNAAGSHYRGDFAHNNGGSHVKRKPASSARSEVLALEEWSGQFNNEHAQRYASSRVGP